MLEFRKPKDGSLDKKWIKVEDITSLTVKKEMQRKISRRKNHASS